MKIDVVNVQNEKVGSLELPDAQFGGRVNAALIWESVVRENAAKRRGTHQTKTRANVSGSGKKPWRQKGTGRARVGEIRNPLWRKGGIVFGPHPRSYEYALPRKVERAALGAALRQKAQEGAVIVVDALTAADSKTKAAAEMLNRWGAARAALLIDVNPDEKLARAVRNIAGVRLVASARVTARDVAGARRVVASKAAIERLQHVIGGEHS